MGKHEALYSLATKQQVAERISEHVLGDEDPVPMANVLVLAEFFNFQPPFWLEGRLRARRAVELEDTHDYGEKKAIAIRQLKRRFLWPQAVLMASVPGMARRIFNLSEQLELSAAGPVPGIEPRQRDFFARMVNPFYFGAARWATVVLTGLVITCVVLLVGTRTNTTNTDRLAFGTVVFLITASVCCAYHGVRLMLGLQQVQSTHRRWLTELVPVWPALLALIVASVPGIPALVPYLFAVPAAAVYITRLLSASRMGCGVAWLALMLPQGKSALTPAIAGLAGTAMLMTLFDWVYAQRHGLPIAATRDNRWTYIGSYVVLVLGFLIWFTWYRRLA